jgi:fermentation-respiration switch protein FrsA (DUF1100 family)
MILELIAVVVAGFAGAGVVMLARRLSAGRLPRWLVPMGAGLAMMAAAVSSEYNWYSRTRAALPEGLAVAETIESRAPWRPWSYAVPITDRFVAVDTARMRENDLTEGLYLADLYFFGRWRPITQVQVMVDCTRHRRADPTMGDGAEPVWRDLGPQDPVIATLCAEV